MDSDPEEEGHERSAAPSTVSVVIPSYNKSAFIGETIESVLAQRDVRVEVVVVDDGSTDDTPQLLDGWAGRIRVHALPGNSGASHARNVGASLAGGDHLVFLDADDVLLPGTLRAMVDALEGRTDRWAACRWQRLRLQEGEWVAYSPDKPLDPPGGDPVAAWLGSWYIPPCAILWPRPLFDRSGGWDEELAATDDEELMIRMLLRGTEIARASDGEARYRFFEAGGTLSTTPSRPLAQGRLRGLVKIEEEAVHQGLLPRYAHVLGKKYFELARSDLAPFPDLALASLARADRFLDASSLPGPLSQRMAARLLGLERKERIARWAERRGIVRRRAIPSPAVHGGGGGAATSGQSR